MSSAYARGAPPFDHECRIALKAERVMHGRVVLLKCFQTNRQKTYAGLVVFSPSRGWQFDSVRALILCVQSVHFVQFLQSEHSVH